MVKVFNDKEIKAIYELFIYGFSEEEIMQIFYGKTIYEIIQAKIENLVERVQEYNENIGLEFENINIVNSLANQEKREQIINSLDFMKNEINNKIKLEIKEILERRVNDIILLIKNIEKIEKDCIKNILIRNKKEVEMANAILNYSMFVGEIPKKTDDIISKETKNIISEEEWKRVQKIVNNVKKK